MRATWREKERREVRSVPEEDDEDDEWCRWPLACSVATSHSAVSTFVRLMGSLKPIWLSSASVTDSASAPQIYETS